jgi:hypothetical protein
MKSAYLYPVTARYESEIVNPYMDDFQKCLENEISFLNIHKPSSTGILDLIKYYFRVNYIFLHWPENIPDRKYGFLQSFFLLFILLLTRLTRKKIIWTMHNKVSNARTNLFLKRVLFRSLIRNSTKIITHASDGLNIVEKNSKQDSKKVFVTPHPVKKQKELPLSSGQIENDILIWGTIVEYKGIDKFLEYLHESGNINKYNIIIAGKVLVNSYYKKIKNLLGEKVKLINEYLDKKELIQIAGKSKIILFPYSKAGVLSSGVLMDSLSWKRTILGPDVGAFRDCADQNIIFSYSDFNDLVQKIENILNNGIEIEQEVLNEFLAENTWPKFSQRILSFIEKN